MEEYLIISSVIAVPFLIGIIITVIDSNRINSILEKFESALRNRYQKLRNSNSQFNKIALKPLFYVLVKFHDWTDNFSRRGLKCGTRVTTMLVFVLLWIGLMFAALYIVVCLLLLYFCWILLRLYLEHKGVISYDGATTKKKEDILLAEVEVDHRVDPNSGIIQEKTVMGWRDTDYGIDLETGKKYKIDILGAKTYSNSGVDQVTGVKYEESALGGKTNSETRINPDTGIIEKKDMFGWNKTDERINLETNRRQKKNLFDVWEDIKG